MKTSREGSDSVTPGPSKKSPLLLKFMQGWLRLMGGILGHQEFSVEFNMNQLVLTGVPELGEQLRRKLVNPNLLRDAIGHILLPVTDAAPDSCELTALALPEAYLPGKNGLALFNRAFQKIIGSGFLPSEGWQETDSGVQLTFEDRELGQLQIAKVKKILSQLSRDEIMESFAADQTQPLPLRPISNQSGALSDVMDKALGTEDDGVTLKVSFNLMHLYCCLQPPLISEEFESAEKTSFTMDKNRLLRYLSFIYGAPRIPFLKDTGVAGKNEVDLVSWSFQPTVAKPNRYVFVLDTSSSMTRNSQDGWIPNASKDYKKSILSALQALIKAQPHTRDIVCFSPFSDACALPSRASDKGGYAEFSLSAKDVLTQVKGYLDKQFQNQLNNGGGTRLLGAAADHLKLIRSKTAYESILIVLTDGKSNREVYNGKNTFENECAQLSQVRRRPKVFIIACGPGVSESEIEKIRKPLDGTLIKSDNPTALRELENHAVDLKIGREVLEILNAASGLQFYSVYDGQPVVLSNIANGADQFIIQGQSLQLVAAPSAPQSLREESEAASSVGGGDKGPLQGVVAKASASSVFKSPNIPPPPPIPTEGYEMSGFSIRE